MICVLNLRLIKSLFPPVFPRLPIRPCWTSSNVSMKQTATSSSLLSWSPHSSSDTTLVKSSMESRWDACSGVSIYRLCMCENVHKLTYKSTNCAISSKVVSGPFTPNRFWGVSLFFDTRTMLLHLNNQIKAPKNLSVFFKNTRLQFLKFVMTED